MSRRYRNRRIGEFLKELDLTEGRSTGVPKILKAMATNGSPPPLFETDDDRAAYVIRLPVHPLARVPEEATDQVTGQVTPQVTPEVPPQWTEAVQRLLVVLEGEMSRQQLQDALRLSDTKHFREAFLQPALDALLIAMTQPDVPRSSKQRYRLTAAGQLAKGVP